jgi:Fe-S cluster biogenesis protein NfuA
MKGKVEAALVRIRHALQVEGGNVELLDVNEGTVRLTGVYGGCPAMTAGLKMSIERMIKERVPEAKEVIVIAI